MFLVLFTPWALGTTQTWSIWIANAACYLLGLLLIGKVLVRRLLPYMPPRWGEDVVIAEASGQMQPPSRHSDLWARILAVLTVAFLGYVLVSALNARAVYHPDTHSFDYLREPWRWLPYSYDRSATWFAFFQFLGLACAFWAVRDWLLHRSRVDLGEDDSPQWANPHSQIIVPARLRRLLWVLCLNAAVLAVVSILQKAEGTNRLLWIADTGNRADLIFGPWAYRGNAATYFNLVWPIGLAFWLWLQERAGRAFTRKLSRFDGPQLVLLPCAVFAAICPMISSSRGGAIVSVSIGALSGLMILVISRREVSAVARWLTTGGMILAGLAALVGGWSTIKERLSRPDTRFATGIDAWTNDFTLLLRVHMPPQQDPKWRPLVSLSGNARNGREPHSLHLSTGGDGLIAAQILGSTTTNTATVVATNVLEQVGGRDTVVSLVRRAGLHLFANGVELGTFENASADAPDWGTYLHTRYIFVFDRFITEIAFADTALSAGDLKDIASRPLDQLGEYILRATPYAEQEWDASVSNAVPTGATLTVTSRKSEPTVKWMGIRRDETPGPLGFARPIVDPDPALHGPLRAAFRVWNPSNLPLTIGVSLDGGPRGMVDIAPRTEQAVSVPCQPPHAGSPRSVEILVTDADGEVRTDLPSGSQFFLREFHLQPGATIFTQNLVREFRLFELSDRMSGRNEIYANAVNMAKDYPLWGSGAGSFASMYQLYMEPGQNWAAYLHNDWMEARVTLGIVGLSLLVAALITLLIRSCFGTGLSTLRIVVVLWWLALAGCLVHARFDFPFQVYSVMFAFVLLASVLMVLTGFRRP